VSALAVLVVGCGRVDKDLTKDPRYQHVLGRSFASREDLVLYRHKRESSVGLHTFRNRQLLPEREKIRPPFPIRYHNTVILGVLPADSVFKVVRVKEEGSEGMSWVYYYVEITKSSAPEWVGKVVYPSDIKTAEWVPKFDPKYVEELP
jgi:hypothetical protein